MSDSRHTGGGAGGHGAEAASDALGIVCPYCGHTQAAVGSGQSQCGSCKGLFDPLSRQATQNAMGPWWVLNPARPTSPGVSYERVCEMVRRGRITRNSIVRGPTTRQFWALARDTAGIAVLLGECHNCHRDVMPDEFICRHCSTVLAPRSDRQHLGLAPVQLLPGQATPEEIAASTRASLTNTPPHPAPRAAPARTARVATSAADDAAEIGSSSARRMRQQLARSRMYLVTLLILVGMLTAAVALLILDPFQGLSIGAPGQRPQAAGTSENPSPFPPPPDESAAPGAEPSAPETAADDTRAAPALTLPEMPPPISEESAPLDAALEPWRARFDEAVALERQDTTQSVTGAIRIIESILEEARDARAGEGAASGGGGEFPIAQDRLEMLRDRLEALELREEFTDPGR